MEIELGDINVTYPNEVSPQARKFRIRTDGDILHFDFIDSKIDSANFFLEKEQVELLIDTLKLVLKNKLME